MVGGEVEERRVSLWRSGGMRALIGVTTLGFASYCLTLASLPVYAVGGGAAESTAGVVTAVFLLATIAVQSVVPALTARFGVGPVLAGGLVAMGVPAPLYVLDDGLLWISALSAVRGAGSPSSPCWARPWPRRWPRPNARGVDRALRPRHRRPESDRRPGRCA